jgi:site-specific DNA recombinase
MERVLFDAVREKALEQWSHRTVARGKSEHLLTGLLFDDAGFRMIPTHAKKRGVRYRYYVSTPFLHGEAKTATAGSVARVPAAEVEALVVKALKDRIATKHEKSTLRDMNLDNQGSIADLIAAVTVHEDRLVLQLKPSDTDPKVELQDLESLTIPWQKPPMKRSRAILLPANKVRDEVKPQQFERRASLVSAIARGRQWLDDIVSGRVTTAAELSAREKCTVRQINLKLSLAFLAPELVKAAVEGRLPRGIGAERLRDLPPEWSRQFKVLGLNPN